VSTSATRRRCACKSTTVIRDNKSHDTPAPSMSEHRPSSVYVAMSRLKRILDKTGMLLARHSRFVGPGLVSSVAYFDP
jgi:hypothetical protein